MRKEFEMTDEDLNKILDACKPMPVMLIGGYSSPSSQERANHAWEELGLRMNFNYMTVLPSNKGVKFFTAEPCIK